MKASLAAYHDRLSIKYLNITLSHPVTGTTEATASIMIHELFENIGLEDDEDYHYEKAEFSMNHCGMGWIEFRVDIRHLKVALRFPINCV